MPKPTLEIHYQGQLQRLKLYGTHSGPSIESAIRSRFLISSDSHLILHNSTGDYEITESIAPGVYHLLVKTAGQKDAKLPPAPVAARQIQNVFRSYSAKKLLQSEKKKKLEAEKEYWQEIIHDAEASPPEVVVKAPKERKSALLIIDVQYDFLPPAGSLAVKGGLDIIPLINKLKERVKFSHVSLSQDFHPKGHVSFVTTHLAKGAVIFTPFLLENGKHQMMWPEHCIQGTKGAEFHSDLKTSKDDSIVQKGLNLHIDSYSAFYDNDHKSATHMTDILTKHGITDVFVVGLAYDYCVGYSALDSQSEGFKTYVVEDCCRGVAPETVESMKTRLKAAGVGIIQSSEIPESGIMA